MTAEYVRELEEEVARLTDAIKWEVEWGHTTVTPPIAVQETVNKVRVLLGRRPFTLRDESGRPITQDAQNGA